MVGVVEGLWLLSMAVPAVFFPAGPKEGVEMGMPEPSCQTAFADDETSEYFSVTEGSSRQGTPRFKGTMGSGTEHSKMKEFSMTGYAEECSVPGLLDVDSLYELGGWMHAQSYKKKEVSK